MAETAEAILLKGDLEYYDKLKTLLKNQGAWENTYTKLLRNCEMKLPYSQHIQILVKEKEYELLLEQVKKHPEYVYPYGKILTKKYKSDICILFSEQIHKEASCKLQGNI
ncbi:MAG: hypothetical protein LBQ98_00115 [Nitrososphaerota archaeon]|nr:hypothetical protein [Nitrososphaerota archaeon]